MKTLKIPLKIADFRTETFPHIASWRGYASVEEWLSAISETAIDHEFDCFWDEHPDWDDTPVFKYESGGKFVLLYLAAIVLANLAVATFGPGVVIANAFLFIGLDLTARDRLHDAWHGKRLFLKMTLLILAGSLITLLLNRDAAQIALASFVAFGSAGVIDTLAYHVLGRYPPLLRINGSNVPSAAVDSLVFPTLAFGTFLPGIVLGQFVAKVVGGFVWSLLLKE